MVGYDRILGLLNFFGLAEKMWFQTFRHSCRGPQPQFRPVSISAPATSHPVSSSSQSLPSFLHLFFVLHDSHFFAWASCSALYLLRSPDVACSISVARAVSSPLLDRGNVIGPNREPFTSAAERPPNPAQPSCLHPNWISTPSTSPRCPSSTSFPSRRRLTSRFTSAPPFSCHLPPSLPN